MLENIVAVQLKRTEKDRHPDRFNYSPLIQLIEQLPFMDHIPLEMIQNVY